ncbi:leucine-rich repeat and calponin homology domain-containing protein 2-like isoform X12 [Haliotis rufescens]|uniref:leucine-rich repeat and calponin homology domain-containing protein 2-like isoform X12 n=1 Tax=Haliotis rufescens TaxID=6454 RepID=UPI00201EB8FC|nr:leucine-rich repeat and calponin homology domain-containing protein 2-like isoform X12 [Haliotis rufescens]
MAATYGSGSQSPPVIGRPLERVFEEAQHTGEVILSGRKLKDYPKISTKFDLVDTIVADLSKNRLGDVPLEICEYHSMERLNCYHNVIKVIPEAIVQLQALTHLNLSRNQLSVLPPTLCHLQALEVLLASNNKLVSLPEEIGKLEKLMDLDVSCNEISHLPGQIGDLGSLRCLNVRRNLLVELPPEICKLNLRKLDFSSNRIDKIPTVFRKIESLEEMVLDHNPLSLPPAHICTRGRQHIMKFLQIEAIKEDRKRGILNDMDMKKLARKSLPPQQTSDELRNMLLESPESRWKRHTVLSADSGYSTTDSLEKCGWSPSEELIRQKADYERRKKVAEQIRRQQEEEEVKNDEKEERRRAAIKVQEEQRAVIERQREQQREEARLVEEARAQEEALRQEEERLKEETRLREEQHRREESRQAEQRKPEGVRRVKGESKARVTSRRNTVDNIASFGYPATLHEDYYGRTYDYGSYDYNDHGFYISDYGYRKQPLSSSSSFKEDRKLHNNTQYRRTTSDTAARRLQGNQNSHVDNLNYINRNGVDDNVNNSSSSTPIPSPNPSPSGSQNSLPSSPSTGPVSGIPSIARVRESADKSTPHQSPVVRRAKATDRTGVASPTPGRGTTRAGGTTAGSRLQGTAKRNHNTSEEEFKQKHQAMKNQHSQESHNLKKKLEDSKLKTIQKDAVHNYVSKVSAARSRGDVEDRKRSMTPRNTNVGTTRGTRSGKCLNGQTDRHPKSRDTHSGPVLSQASMKLLEEYKDADPNFTIRRQHDQRLEEIEQIEQLRTKEEFVVLRDTIESRLKVTLPENLPDALKDGVVLCHLANQIRPRSVGSIHVPSPAVPKLTMAKCRRNVENFLDACRKIGVDQADLCACEDIVEEIRLARVANTVQHLVTFPRLTSVDYYVTYLCIAILCLTCFFLFQPPV